MNVTRGWASQVGRLIPAVWAHALRFVLSYIFQGSQDSCRVSQGRQPVLETITSKITHVRDNYSNVSRVETMIVCIF